jgi:transcriptional regulator with XRE-family HTH domain
MAKPIPRHVKVSVAAVVAFGDRGHSKLAAAAGISRQMMSFIVNGDREATDDVYRRIAAALLKEADHQRASAAKIDELAGKILADLEK